MAVGEHHHFSLHFSRLGTAAVAGAMALSMAACGSSQAPGVSGPPTFSGPAQQSVTSDSGQLSIAVRWWPVVPVQGNDAAELTIVDAQGAPVDGLMMSIVPWMPAHGHGCAHGGSPLSVHGGRVAASNDDLGNRGGFSHSDRRDPLKRWRQVAAPLA